MLAALARRAASASVAPVIRGAPRVATAAPRLAPPLIAYSQAREYSSVRAKLQEVVAAELKHERETQKEPDTDDPLLNDTKFVENFTESSGWDISDQEEYNSVTLLKETENGETVEIVFDTGISELDDFKESEGEMEAPLPSDPAPTTVSLNVYKTDGANKNQLAIELTFENDNLYFDKIQVRSRGLEEGETDEDFYPGPLYNSLDPDLQEGLGNYLTELGIDSQLFRFIESYSIIKEQREYTAWLERFNGFLK